MIPGANPIRSNPSSVSGVAYSGVPAHGAATAKAVGRPAGRATPRAVTVHVEAQ